MRFKAFYLKTRPPGPQSTSSERHLSVAESFQKQLTLHIIEGTVRILIKSFRASY